VKLVLDEILEKTRIGKFWPGPTAMRIAVEWRERYARADVGEPASRSNAHEQVPCSGLASNGATLPRRPEVRSRNSIHRAARDRQHIYRLAAGTEPSGFD